MLEKPEPEECPYCGNATVDFMDETTDTARWKCPDCGVFAVEISPGRRGP